MKKAFWLVLLLPFVLLSCQQQANDPLSHPHYELMVNLNPESQSIRVQGSLTQNILSDSLSEMTFYLHKQLVVEQITANYALHFQTDTVTPSGYNWLPDAGRIILHFDQPVKAGDQLRLKFSYGGTINHWTAYSANRLTPEWVEMGLYFPWFLHQTHMEDFTYRIELDCPDSYKVSGMQDIKQEGRKTILQSRIPVNDMVIIASPNLKTYALQTDHLEIRFDYISLDDSLVRQMAQDDKKIIEFLTNRFGPIPLSTVHVIQSPRQSGGGYARLGGVVLGDLESSDYEQYYTAYQRYFAHELAHLWWHKAPKDSWEDWINEGFAEYTALQYLRNEFGLGEYEKWLRSKQLKAKNKPAIWGFDRHKSKEETTYAIIEDVLYSKGPVILADLENEIGTERYDKVTKELLQLKEMTTTDLLRILESIAGMEARQKFENELN